MLMSEDIIYCKRKTTFKIYFVLFCLEGYLCQNDCKPSGRGMDFRGKVSHTESGKTCQHWNTQDPHTHFYGDMFKDGAASHSNYCRNPDPKTRPLGPWCLTTDPGTEWEYCDIPLCQNPQPVASWIFDEEHGGIDTSFLGENPATLTGITYGPGLNGALNGSAVTPVSDSQSMLIVNPTAALRFDKSMTFVAYVYLTHHVGPLFGYIQWNLHFWVYPQGDTLWINYVSNQLELQTRSVLSLNAWHKVCMTIRDNFFTIYVNDTFVATWESNIAPIRLSEITGSGMIYLGSKPGDSRLLKGRMACAKFYDIALNESEMGAILCENFACTEIINGKCTGNCLGVNAGDRCDSYILPLIVPSALISTRVIGTHYVDIVWQPTRHPALAKRNFYHFLVLHQQRNADDIQQSSPIHLTEDDVYMYTIHDLQIDTQYDIIIRSVRIVGNLVDHTDSEPVNIKTICVEPGNVNGLFVYKTEENFIISWTTSLVELDSGCSSKVVTLHYKYTESNLWIRVVLDQTLTNYTLPSYDHGECYVKMVAVNNAGLETSSTVLTTRNATKLPDLDVVFTTLSYSESSQSSAVTETPNGKAYSQPEYKSDTLFIASICMCVIGVCALICSITVAIVCWKRTRKYRAQKEAVDVRKDELNLSTMQIAKGKTNTYKECENADSNRDETYQEIGPNEHVQGPHYEPLDV